MSLPNLDWLRGLSTKEIPDLGTKLHEIVTTLSGQVQQVASQTNSSIVGNPVPPPAISKLTVSASNGHFSAAIADQGPVYRGVSYGLEHADNPQFTNPQFVHLGPSRNWNGYLGNVTRYFRAFPYYSTTEPGKPAYHGSAAQPLPVSGGSGIAASFQDSQGSGTGLPGVGLQGPGKTPFRSSSGIAPVR